MKNKKGFTLMEILTVIAIIGIIMLIAIPSIMGIGKSIKRRQLETKKKVIISAAEVYAKNNVSKFGGGDILRIPVRTLLYYGYITKEAECSESIGCIINPVDDSSMNDEIITIKRNMAITQAEWGKEYGNEMCATFDWNDGSGRIESRCCSESYKKCEIKTPTITRNGFEILGWNTTSTATEGKIEEDTKITITGSITYYGITKKNVTVTFNPNGGQIISGEDRQKCSYYNKKTSCAVTAPGVEKVGFGLDGWYYTNNTKANLSKISDTTTLYAHWNLGEYTITYNLNGGSFTTTPKTSYTIEDEFNLPKPQKDGNVFNGWYETSGLTGTAVTKISLGTIGNKTFYAKWTPCATGYSLNSDRSACIKNVVTVMYNGNGQTGFSSGSSYNFTVNSNGYVLKNGEIYKETGNYGEAFDSSSGLANYNNSSYISFSKTGYHGVSGSEWYIENSSGTKTKFSQTDTAITAVQLASAGGCDLSKQNCTVTAKVNWDINRVYVQYNGNGQTSFTTSSTTHNFTVNSSGTVLDNGTVYKQSGKYGEAFSTSDGLLNYNGTCFNFTKTGYSVPSGSEWYIENSSGTKTKFNHNDTTVTAVQLASAGGCDLSKQNCTVTAKVNWDINRVYVQYNGNGQTGFSSGSSYNFTVNSNGYVLKNGEVYKEAGKYGEAFNSSSGLANYNNSNYINFTKTGYSGVSGSEWYIENSSGTKTMFNQADATVTSNALATAGGCNLSKQNCTVTAKVNWEQTVLPTWTKVVSTCRVKKAAYSAETLGSETMTTCEIDTSIPTCTSAVENNTYKTECVPTRYTCKRKADIAGYTGFCYCSNQQNDTLHAAHTACSAATAIATCKAAGFTYAVGESTCAVKYQCNPDEMPSGNGTLCFKNFNACVDPWMEHAVAEYKVKTKTCEVTYEYVDSSEIVNEACSSVTLPQCNSSTLGNSYIKSCTKN